MRIVFLLLFFPIIAIGQTLSGYVYDEAQDLPMPGATVYIDGTTLSSITDENGYFSINAPSKYNAALIISYIGYKTFSVPDPFSYDAPIKILLREDVISLEAVTVTKQKGPFTRKEMLKAFREQFLGKSRAGQSCTIANEEDIVLYYDTQYNSLIANAKEPLRIVNKRLDYYVTFDLVDFRVNYRQQTLDGYYVDNSFFAGTTLFADIAKNKNKAEKIRGETYLGSVAHLMKTIVSEDWEKQKFRFYAGNFPANPKEYLKISDSLNYKKVTLIDPYKKPNTIDTAGMNLGQANPQPGHIPAKEIRYNVLYDSEEQSVFMFSKGYFYVDENGLFFPLTELIFGGHIGSLKVGDLLPADYKYKG